MANGDTDPRVYQALALPSQALDNGGAEILRAGIIDGELYVTARRAFKDPAKWGELLAEVAGHLAAIYVAEVSGLSKKDVTVQIAEAFAAEMGALPVKNSAPKVKAKPSRAKKMSKKPSKKSARSAAKCRKS